MGPSGDSKKAPPPPSPPAPHEPARHGSPPGAMRRLFSLVYDSLLLFATLFAATIPALALTDGEAIRPGNPLFLFYLLSVSYLYFGWCWTRSGQTLGMRAWNLRLVAYPDKPIGWGLALLRFVAAILSLIPAGLGFLWFVFDSEKRTLHDRLCNTAIEYIPSRRS
ncbi:MAG: RDD family protein [Ectothiorhodospiraceae bacterium AqS1]|nr:RDD family protein [Ectothiorhodospiraceae bacterium AqS1]